jgi:hypothetical protein
VNGLGLRNQQGRVEPQEAPISRAEPGPDLGQSVLSLFTAQCRRKNDQ